MAPGLSPVRVRPAVSKLAVKVVRIPTATAALAAARISSGADMVSIPDEIGAALRESFDLFDEDGGRVLFADRPKRREKVARGADGAGHDHRSTCRVGDGPRVGGRQPVELANPAIEPVQHETTTVRPERVGQNDVGAGIDEVPMQPTDTVRVGLVPQFGRLARQQAHGKEIRSGRAIGEQRTTFVQQRREGHGDLP